MEQVSPIDVREIGKPGDVERRLSSSRRVFRNTLLLVGADVIGKVGLFVLYAVIARSLGSRAFGEYTLAVSLAFFVRAATLGLDLILSREAARGLERVDGLYWETIVLKLATAVVVLVGIVVFAADQGYSEGLIVTALLIGLSNVVDVIALSTHAVLRGRELMGPPARALALETTAVASVGTIVVLPLHGGLPALGIVYLASAFAAWLYIAGAAARCGIRPQRRGSTRGLAWLARAAVPTGIASFLGVALARLDALILSVMTGDTVVVGLYGGAYRLFEATLFLNWALGSAIYPLLARLKRHTRSLGSVFELSSVAICGVTFPLAGAMLFYGPTILKITLGTSFAGGGTAARILAGATASYGLFTVAALTIVGQNRESLFPRLGAVALAVNVILDVSLIPSLSLNGAAVAMTVAQTVATGITVGFALRETGRLSVGRALAAPVAGVLAMAIPVAGLGLGGAALLVSSLAYVVGFVVVEWLWYPDDLRLLTEVVRRRAA